MTDLEALTRIGVATLLGATVGLERELTGKPAGLRTHMLVAEGAALFMVASILLGEKYGFTDAPALRVDVTRIASTIVTGVGFLGGGMILRARDRVYGLTTAAGIWVAAAIGTLVGAGFYAVPIIGTAIAVVTLVAVRGIERRIAPVPPGTYAEEEDD